METVAELAEWVEGRAHEWVNEQMSENDMTLLDVVDMGKQAETLLKWVEQADADKAADFVAWVAYAEGQGADPDLHGALETWFIILRENEIESGTWEATARALGYQGIFE